MVAGSDQTLNALGISGQDEIPEINNTSPQDRGRNSGSSGGGGKSLPPMGKKKNVLSFEAPNIVDDPAVDKDSPWGNDTKLNQLASSGRWFVGAPKLTETSCGFVLKNNTQYLSAT